MTGLAFYAGRDNLLIDLIRGRISNLGLPNCSSYADFLDDGAAGSAEMDVLIAGLTIGETYFFRDKAQFAAIRDIILPDILKRNTSTKQLRIWSAGCATGAEPYSLAILLELDLGDQIAGWQVDIHASDLNRSSLSQAAEGKFRAWALRATPDTVKRECFSNEGLVWTIHPRFKQWISFHHMNLIDSAFSTPLAGGRFDLILCRNVMIYFAPEVSRHLVGQFHESLEEGGWLVVSATESNLKNYTAFRTVGATGTRLYQKIAFPGARTEVAPEPVVAQEPPEPSRADIAGIEVLRQLADRGDWQGASEYSQRLLTQDRLNPAIHFYQALIFENLGIVDQPERSLRQAIYLDRSFALAHYHLGLTLKLNGQMLAAARSFQNVLKVLAETPDHAILTAGPGLTATDLKELAKIQLEKSVKV